MNAEHRNICIHVLLHENGQGDVEKWKQRQPEVCEDARCGLRRGRGARHLKVVRIPRVAVRRYRGYVAPAPAARLCPSPRPPPTGMPPPATADRTRVANHTMQTKTIGNCNGLLRTYPVTYQYLNHTLETEILGNSNYLLRTYPVTCFFLTENTYFFRIIKGKIGLQNLFPI